MLKKIKKYFNKKKLKNKPIIRINMFLRNNEVKSFDVISKKSFIYNKGSYIIDSTCSYFSLTHSKYILDYHEDFALPIKRTFNINDLNKAVNDVNCEVSYSTNPSVLEHFITSRIAEGILKGQEIDDFLKKLRGLVLIGLLIGAGSLVILLAKSGVLKTIGI